MTVVFQKWITREDLQNNPDTVYVFGDNAERVGMGGQAKFMRGEFNAYGIATKQRPSNNPGEFFSDDNAAQWSIIQFDVDYLRHMVQNGKKVVIPADGLGTGLSRLPQMAPKMYKWLYDEITKMAGTEIPWPKPNSTL
jgi:hypothetical protein